MWEPTDFISKYFNLIKYCEDMSSFDSKIFKQIHDEYSKKYQKLDQADQGLIAEQIHNRFKDA